MNKSKRIAITGVSRGLGRAMTAGFLETGHMVYGCSRSAEAVDVLQGEFASGTFAAVDVTADDAVGRWAKAVIDDGGPPDLLLNNAALINEPASLWEISSQHFREVVDVNINGTFHVIRHFVPAMVERGAGVIVNFSSGWGRSTSPEVAPYCATKWAIEGLTRALADELPAGLAAVALNPGVIDTDMLRTCWGDGAGAYPSPESWAQRAVPFLLGLNASHNGQPLTVPM